MKRIQNLENVISILTKRFEINDMCYGCASTNLLKFCCNCDNLYCEKCSKENGEAILSTRWGSGDYWLCSRKCIENFRRIEEKKPYYEYFSLTKY